MTDHVSENQQGGIAIVGMAGRFPGAKDVAEFWTNLRGGIESVIQFSDDDLRAAGISEAALADPSYVKASSTMPGTNLFDAEYFKYSAREAELIDPQQRLFLECAVETLENAGCDPRRFNGAIGVFGGAGFSSYLLSVLDDQQSAIGTSRSAGTINRTLAVQGSDKDYLATRTSYKLGLRGPSLTVQTACSTSLVAVHLACQSLLAGECDFALAGGVSVSGNMRKGGYYHVEGGILSSDGHCRPFDARASGTIFGEGVGLVALKRLSDAIADRDHIRAVIRGSAINNDGAVKVGFTAPSIDGQASVIAEALAVGEIAPETIGYVEAHGTGTALGDPIEIEALHQVFRTALAEPGRCAIGSVKANVGHLNTAAGIAGLIKAVLCVETAQIPPSLNFDTPNPAIDFTSSPFFIARQLTSWPRCDGPRRAGVSSFGIGGTNAHLVLEEAPKALPGPTTTSIHVAVLSAKTGTVLDRARERMAAYLLDQQQESIADICHTLAIGRQTHSHACVAIGRNAAELADALTGNDGGRVVVGTRAESGRPVVFLFPGQGAQHAGIGRQLYAEESVFRAEVDRCAELIRPHLALDLRALLFPAEGTEAETNRQLTNTEFAQPAVFVVSYALARLWMSFGIQPRAALGHSIGEFVAACMADVFSLEDALKIVVQRGRLLQSLPRGAMLAIAAAEQQVLPLLSGEVSIAAVNGPASCVASGPAGGIESLMNRLAEARIPSTLLHTSHAFHSKMMIPAVKPLVDLMRTIKLQPPRQPYISNVSGTWISDQQATSPDYWGRHLVEPVQFHRGVKTVLKDIPGILLEVGPGRTLTALVDVIAEDVPEKPGKCSLPRSGRGDGDEIKTLLRTAGELWLSGVSVSWANRYQGECRYRRPLPGYPFDGKPYWIANRARERGREVGPGGGPALPYHMHAVTWKRADLVEFPGRDAKLAGTRWIIFASRPDLGEALLQSLQARGGAAVLVASNDDRWFKNSGSDRYSIRKDREEDFRRLFTELDERYLQQATPQDPLNVIYLCGAGARGSLASHYEREVVDKMISIMFVLRQLDAFVAGGNVALTIVTSDLLDVSGAERTRPLSALALGPCLAAAAEYPRFRSRVVDLPQGRGSAEQLAAVLIEEVASRSQDVVTACRGQARWVPLLDPVSNVQLAGKDRLRSGGVYLVTGGLGDLGLAISLRLAEAYGARLVLIGRTAVPDRSTRTGTPVQDDRVARILDGIENIEAAGGEVMVGQADVSDFEEMSRIVAQADRRFGTINGIIHAAGIPGRTPIGIKTLDEVHDVLRPKILGLAVIERLFKGRQLDFIALFSSISGLQARPGQFDYSAANACLDAYSRAGTAPWPTIAINWDTWCEIGMAVTAPGATAPAGPRRGLRTAVGVNAFIDALKVGARQVVITASDAGPTYPVEAPQTAGRVDADSAPTAPSSRYHPRPDLPQPYVAPETDLELAIAAMWSELLKTEPIGLSDSFFDLGGHSLLALQLLPRVRDKYQIMLEPREFFASPSIAGLVALIEDKLLAELDEVP